MNRYTQEQVTRAAQEVFPGIALYARDCNLSESVARSYTSGRILCEPGFTDASCRFMGMPTTHRFVILSNHMADLTAFEHATGWGLHVAQAGSHFKVLGVETLCGKTGIFLLHLPDNDDWKIFQSESYVIEERLFKQALDRFMEKLQQPPIPELSTAEWLIRCASPVGMDENGEFFPLENSAEDTLHSAETALREQLRDRFRGCLLGGAVGDALGYPIEFQREPEIVMHYGPQGIQTLRQAGSPARISDDTQMTLFAANGLMYYRHNPVDLRTALWTAYREWLGTQGNPSRMDDPGHPKMELYNIRGLHARRAPGKTCLDSISRSPSGGTAAEPINASKGCGTVMRAAPFGVVASGSDTPEEGMKFAYEAAALDAALTHGHPLAWESSGILAQMINAILRADPKTQSLAEVLEPICENPCTVLSNRLTSAFLAAQDARIPDLHMIHELGEGWVAEEALSIAVFCALRHSDDIAAGIRSAVNHSGDSDSTGAICGSILGAWHGAKALRSAFDLGNLELADVIESVADQLFDEVYGTDSPEDSSGDTNEIPEPAPLKPLRQVGFIYTDLTKKALEICFDAHKHQKDKSGMPYVFHPFHMAEQMETEEEICTALLHDVLEDSFYTVEDLRMGGFPESVISAVEILTRTDGEPYLDYVSRVRCNPIARRVKLADLRHNSNLRRLSAVTQTDLNRVLKYRMAMAVLADDPYDSETDTYCKKLPLSEQENTNFLVRYSPNGAPLIYEIQTPAGTFQIRPEDAADFLRLTGSTQSFPEALAEIGPLHNWDFRQWASGSLQ